MSESESTAKFNAQVTAFGINPSKIYRNLSVEKLVEISVEKNEGMVTSTSSLSVKTGKYTGRSPDDRFIVFDDLTHDKVHWGKVNKQIPTETFEKLSQKMKKFVGGKELFVFDGFVGADPERMLIGDDEHGWSDNGIFNFEGGCYAKCINLKEESEPQIWNAVKNGAVLENVVIDKESLKPNFDDGSLTENTRAAYPLNYIPGAVIPSVGGNPKVIIFLTADAMGVLPPMAKLSKNAAMFHFMSGYTSKLAGTERGVKEPKATFSKCFGAPFMPRLASVYAKMLGEKISKHNTAVYLINTGWSGGPYGVGKRIKIEYSRAMVTAAITGSLDIVKFSHNDVFNLDVPTECPGVPSKILDSKSTWIDKDAYDLSAKKLAQMFADNFKKFENMPDEIRLAGPRM